jgi:hypothetical protein
LGRQDGPKAEICFAFEILVKKEGTKYVLDKEYWLYKEEQCKKLRISESFQTLLSILPEHSIV